MAAYFDSETNKNAKTDPFNPNDHQDNVLEAFNHYISTFHYTYDAIAKDPPTSVTEEEDKKSWHEVNKRKMFLGRYSSRELQQEYEECVEEGNRGSMTFTNMVRALQERFKLSSNTTLANFKFRALKQKSGESFNQFVIRLKQEATTCNFSCAAAGCDVQATLVRDQILFGTHNDEVRRHALHEQWNLEDLVKNGRSLEAATQGADKIKPNKPTYFPEEPNHSILRAQPKKYSRKSVQFDNLRKKKDVPKSGPQCHTCSSRECKGRTQCSGRNVTCYACRKKGHYKNSLACKHTTKARRTRNDPEESDSSDENQASASDIYESETDSDQEQGVIKASRARLTRLLPGIRKVNGVRKPPHRKRRSSPGKYNVEVIINQVAVIAFADTGADICITSLKNARKMNLPLEKSKVKIQPYGSKARACIGKYSGTIMHGGAVANATIYVIKKDVETLLSGQVCEQLGIITFNTDPVQHINKLESEEDSKQRLGDDFPNLFDGVGVLKDHVVKFHVDESVKPKYQPARPIPFHLREKFMTELGKMEEAGIIEEHTGPSPWVSNVVLSPKDDGDIRITVDLREPNKAMMPNRSPIIRPEEIKAQLSSYKFFSKIDFKSAYWQLNLDEESRKLTVFHAGERLMRYKRLPMGACPATGELAEALRPIFADLKDVHPIHDDVIIGGRTQEEHDANLYAACKKIQESGMTLNIKKCIIGKSEIPWWGLIITDKGVRPDPKKVEALQHAARPRNKDEVKSFLCMVQSNKDFIPNIARLTTNLRNLTKKHTQFMWTKRCQDEFEKLCSSFKEETLLKHYDPDQHTYIFVDAHRTGLSAILAQGDSMETSKPVAFASRATTQIENRYPQLDLEALAIDFGMRRFRLYLVGAPEVVIITDHKPLEAIFKNKRQGSIRSERIKLRHQDIRYRVVWRDGKHNPADYLSRHATPLRQTTEHIRKESGELEKLVWFVNYGPYTEAVSMDKIIKHTATDKTLKLLKEAIKKGYIAKKDTHLTKYRKVFDQITLSDEGLLLKDDKIILPSRLIATALEKAHQGGHPGMSCMKRRMRAHFWFPGMDSTIEEYVKECKSCEIFTNKKTHSEIHHHWPNESWKDVNIDLFGPMPDNKHVLVVTDSMSRFPAAKIVPSTSAKPVIDALTNIYSDFGQPDSHRTDNGPPFDSKAFTEFSTTTGTKHIRTFPYHPQANPAETFMKPLGKSMKIAHHNGENKSAVLNQLLTNYRATPHSATGVSPGDVLFRSGYRSGFPRTQPLTDQQAEAARERDVKQRSERADKLNSSKYRKDDSFQVGDVVYTRNNNRTSKFQPTFDPTPRTVVEVGKGGITCVDEWGTRQRRHSDDVKKASTTSHITINTSTERHETTPYFISTKQLTPRQATTTAPNTQDTNQATTTTGQTSPSTEIADRPHRNIQPPTRYRSDEFTTTLKPRK